MGYFSWLFKCYGNTLKLFFNIQNASVMEYFEVMLLDVVALVSGLVLLFFIFDWIPNGIIEVLGIDINNNADI